MPHSPAPCSSRGRGAFTLLEVLIALTITMMLTGLVLEVFAHVGEGVTNSRAMMELSDALRHAKHRLIQDLRGVTAPTVPPLDPSKNLGYFEYVEGPRVANSQFAPNSVGGDIGENLHGNWYTSRGRATNIVVNSIIGDVDDILMFTTRSISNKFVGRGRVQKGITKAATSRYAEVAWFLRRRTQSEARSTRGDNRTEYYTLHRRQFLVLPNSSHIGGTLTYANTDLSLRPDGGTCEPQALPPNLTRGGERSIDPLTRKNSLGDLTMRERRSLHQPYHWPYQMMYVAPQFGNNVNRHYLFNPGDEYTVGWNVPTSALSLPTLAEQSHDDFPAPQWEEKKSGKIIPKSTFTPTPPVGYNVQQYLKLGRRAGDDIVLANVVSFDVKAWDPGAPIFQAQSTETNPNNAGVVVPGDGGYIRAVDLFNSSPTTPSRQPVAFGAFADLNFMATEAAYPNNVKRYRTYMNPANAKSLSALDKLEAGTFRGRCRLPRSQFAYPGDGALAGNPTNGSFARPAVWDTWSTHYEYDGIDNNGNGVIDEFTNGVDDNGNGLVDEPNIYNGTGEREAPPPYRSPLRGLKITLRVMEQDSKQVREVVVVHEFVPY